MSPPVCGRALQVSRAGLAPRALHTSQAAHASVLTSPAPPSANHTPILDIFDAPVMLGTLHSARDRRGPLPRAPAPQPRSPPRPLPPPTLFDGPAQPQNLPVQFQSLGRTSKHAYAQKPHPRTPPPAVSFGTSEPLVQLFDGPARITRCVPRPAKGPSASSTKYLMLLGLAGAVGGATQIT